MSNIRKTTPPMTPPAMAPTLIVEAEEVVKVLVVFPDDVDAAAATEGDDAVDSAGDWSDVMTDKTALVSVLAEDEAEEQSEEVLGV